MCRAFPCVTQLSQPVPKIVSDVERAMGFYVSQLGFVETNRYAEEGKVLVRGLARDGCALLLTSQWPQKNGHGATGSCWMSPQLSRRPGG